MDADYLKRSIGPSLVKCLAEVCSKKPVDPIEYIALWLHKEYINKNTRKQEEEEEVELVKQRELYRIEKERECERRKEMKRIKMEQEAERKAAEEREAQRKRNEEAARLRTEEEAQEKEEEDKEEESPDTQDRGDGLEEDVNQMSRVIEEEKDHDDDESGD